MTLKNRLIDAFRWKRHLSNMKSLLFFSWIKQLIFCVNKQKTVKNDVENNLKLKNERLKLEMKVMQQKLKRMKKKLTEKKNIQFENQTLKMQLKKNKQQFLNDYFKNGIAKIMKFFFWYIIKVFRNIHLILMIYQTIESLNQ